MEVPSNLPDFLTDQPVEGELLAEILARGGLSGESALRYAIEIGTALAKAHARGMVHGSLSPHAIAIGSDGAHILRPRLVPDARSTPYRPPEQTRSGLPGTAGDIFAYGTILREMTGSEEQFLPSGGQIRYHLALDRVIAGCQEPDPAARRQRIQNAVIELRLEAARIRALRAAMPVTPVLPSRPGRGEWPPRPVRNKPLRRLSPWMALGIMALALVTVAAGAAAVFAILHPTPGSPAMNFPVPAPDKSSHPGPPAISPDGRLVAFAATGADGRRLLWLRPLDTLQAAPLPGTEGASAPFWSPDNRYIGFFADQALKKIPAAGGPAVTVCPADALPGGGSWNPDGTILFAPGLTGGLYRVPAEGGVPELLLQPDSARAELAYLWPQFLPDGRHFLFFVSTILPETTGVYGSSAGTPAIRRMILASETNAVFSTPPESRTRKHGYLLFVRGRAPMVQEFNAADLSVSGEAISLGDDIGAMRSIFLAPISVSNNATLVYLTVGEATRQMVWLTRTGKPIAASRETGEWGPPRVSPDGTRAAATRLAPGGQADLWTIDAAGKATPFSEEGVRESFPVWSPDGGRLVFSASGKGAGSFDLFVKPVIGGRMEALWRNDFSKHPTDWSRDGRYVFFTVKPPTLSSDVWAVATDTHHAAPLLNSIYNEDSAALSPDGKWLAYQSDESGGIQVYVQAFDGLGVSPGVRRRWQISTEGGGVPRWRADGKELFYATSGGSVVAVAVRAAGGQFGFDPPQTLFQTRPVPKTWNTFDVSPDGQRFLMNVSLELSNSSSLTVLTNWTEKLVRLATP